MTKYFVFIFLFIISISCNKRTVRTNDIDDLEISKLIVINEKQFGELTSSVLSSSCFVRNSNERKILYLSFQNLGNENNKKVDFVLSLLQYSYIYDQEDLRGIYGGFWIKYNKDSLLLIVDNENIPQKLFNKSKDFISIKKYKGGPIGMSDIVWIFRQNDEKFEFVSEQCNNKE